MVCLWLCLGCLAFGAEQNSSRICEEEEYVLLTSGNNYAEIYDCEGNCVGKCRAYLDEYCAAATIEKESILTYADGENWTVFSMAQRKNILEFPIEGYSISVSGDKCLVTDYTEKTICLYDNNGTLLYSDENEALGDEYGGYGKLMRLEEGYLVGVCVYTEENTVPAKNPVWISEDGEVQREINAFEIVEAFYKGNISSFGDYLVIHDWQNGNNSVYDLNGTLLLDQVETCIYPYISDSWAYDITSDIVLVIKKNQERYTAYDKNLNIYATFPYSGDAYLQYADGFLEGMRYEELGGNVCYGFLTYNGEKRVPYAKTEEGAMVYVDGQLISIPLNEGEDPVELNEAYVTAGGYNDEDTYVKRLIYRESGETLLDSLGDEKNRFYFTLGRDYCIITEQDRESYRSVISIRDDQNEICYSSNKVQCQPWKNGYIVLKRGIYQGIADRNGNWIIKTTAGWNE